MTFRLLCGAGQVRVPGSGSWLLAGLVFTGALCGAARPTQAQSGPLGKESSVLVVQEETIKNGREGDAHHRAETNYVEVERAAHTSFYYTGMTSLSGHPQALFFSFFPSMAAWEKASLVFTDAHPDFGEALDRANEADSANVEEYRQSVYMLRPDLSFNPARHTGARYVEVVRFESRPGHDHETEEAFKMYDEAYRKALPAGHFAVYESMYAQGSGTQYLLLMQLSSLADADTGIADDEKVSKAFTPEQLKKIQVIEQAALVSASVNLYRIDPKMSYPSPETIAAEPAFWQPTPATP